MIEARIAPFINVQFTVTSEWWEQPRNHRGLDIATGNNDILYSMCNGTIVYKGYEAGGYGNYIIIKDSTSNMGFLYAHMKEPSNKNLYDDVVIGEQVGIEGATGDVTGIHLHLEMQDLTNHEWIYHAPKETYTNPAEFMGIPNIEGTVAIYYGVIPTTKYKSNFKWVLYANKIRSRVIS